MKRVFWILLCFSILPALFAEAPSLIAIRNARVVTVSGPVLSRATVVVRDGLIEAVGENAAVPPGAWVVEGEGLTVYPGLVDALSTWGIEAAGGAAPSAAGRTAPATPARPPTPATPSAPPAQGPEDRPSNTSWVRAADLVRPTDRRLEQARNAGFTTAVTFPTSGIFAGQGAVVDLAGERSGQMIVASPAGLYLSMTSSGGGFPNSSMGVIAYIRQVYLDASHYRMAKAAYEQHPAGMKRPDYDRSIEGVLESPRILLPATRAVEIDRMVRFAEELKTKAVIYGAHEAYHAAEELKRAGMPVLVNLRWPERARDADPDQVESLRVLELRDKAPSAPAALAKAGVLFAFYSGGIERPRDTWTAVKKAIDAGLDPQAAVRALTLSPAEIYGVADRLGSIEPGKIANLVVTNGDLFQEKTQVKYVFVDGAKFEPLPEPREEANR